MPMYDRHCNACDELFVITCKISEKENLFECPYCGSVDGDWRPSAPASSIRPDRFMGKQDTGFKEVLSKIQERNKRTEICKR